VFNLRTKSLIACIMAANLTLATAGAPIIGVAIKSGSFTVDGSKISGNATLFEGTTIDTGSGAARVQLTNGTRVQLSAESTGKIFRDRMVLEKGSGQLDASGAYRMEALNLRVSGSSARLALRDGRTLRVDAVGSDVQVTTSKGTLIASLAPGSSLDFMPPAGDGAAAPTKLVGVVTKRGSSYLLQDETSKITVELIGDGLESLAGQRVEIEGAPVLGGTPAQGASQVIRVAKSTKLGKAAVVKAAGAAHAGHLSTAVIAGVGVAAAAAGTGIVLSRGDNTPQTVSPSSR
jgi:hypothetical protein